LVVELSSRPVPGISTTSFFKVGQIQLPNQLEPTKNGRSKLRRYDTSRSLLSTLFVV